MKEKVKVTLDCLARIGHQLSRLNHKAYLLYFDDVGGGITQYDRQMGFTIRPVFDPEIVNGNNLPIYLSPLECIYTSPYYILSVKVKPTEGYPIIDYGWEFCDDENYINVLNAKDIPGAVIFYSGETLQAILPEKYVDQYLSEVNTRAYVKCSEGVSYCE